VPDVVIVGGGAIGLAVAWTTARRGAAVTVVDPAPGSGASHVAAGMLAPAGEAQFGEERLLALALESWRRYPGFVAELEAESGCTTGYRECGSLFVARDADDLASMRRDADFRAQLGLDTTRLTSRECRRLEPRLAPGTRGGFLAVNDHQIDPRALIEALLVGCARAGVTVVREAPEIVSDGGGVAGVRTSDGTLTADAVVLAAGSWSAQVRGLPGTALPPVRPVKGQILRLRDARRQPLAAHLIRGRDVYIVPRADGRVVVGATVEERGYDASVTAGAVHDLLRDARELVPDVAELELVEAAAGLRPGTPDNAPIIGWSGVRRLLIATGHHRNGILLTPITADVVAALLAGEAAPALAGGFGPERFTAVAQVVA
jgi:glycine oxidase